MATIKKNEITPEKQEKLKKTAEDKEVKVPETEKPKQANTSPKKTKLDPKELLFCIGSYTQVMRKDMCMSYGGGNYSRAFLESKGIKCKK